MLSHSGFDSPGSGLVRRGDGHRNVSYMKTTGGGTAKEQLATVLPMSLQQMMEHT